MEWYALYCRPNSERRVVEKLDAEGIEAFYPHRVEKVTAAHRAGGVREVDRKFMPGYAFAQFDYPGQSRLVIEISQIVQVLGWGRSPVPIPEFEVASIRLLQNHPSHRAIEPCQYVQAGDRVRVQRGPLAGLEGFVVYMKGKARVIVSVTMLARSISAEVDVDTLEMLDPSPAVKRTAAGVVQMPEPSVRLAA
jgi:transcription antitermination factor NusG